jgi:hypothetical protein
LLTIGKDFFQKFFNNDNRRETQNNVLIDWSV